MKTGFTNGERRVLLASCTPALLAALAVNASAMHIMEGFLPQGHAIAWGVVCLPFLVWGFLSIQKIVANHRKAILLLAMMGAYAFVLSALKMPSVTGSSSHPTGTGLGAVLFGPAPMALLGLLVLCAVILIFPLMTIKDSEFGGADGAAEKAIATVDPDYDAWADPILEAPGGEIESLLFCLQAALGAIVIGYGFGYLAGRKKYSPKEAS